jgi:hypothetical protein
VDHLPTLPEIDKRPSPEYVDASRASIAAVFTKQEPATGASCALND